MLYPFLDDAREHERLALQGAYFADQTRAFFQAARIGENQRVLDFGCGVGEVAALLCERLGPGGKLVAIDEAENSLEVARQRLAGAAPTLEFVHSDVEHYKTDKPFDAIVGRCVLMYSEDPVARLRALSDLLAPGGVLALQEPDHTFYGLPTPPSARYQRLHDQIVAHAARCEVHDSLGLRLKRLYEEAGLTVTQEIRATRFDGGPDHSIYRILALTWANMMRRARERGWDGGMDVDAEALARELETEAVANDLRVSGSSLIGVVGTRG